MLTAHLQIVGFNHRRHLADCLRSCLAQTVRVPVLFIDNASSDGSADMVRHDFPTVHFRANATNRGYSGGHNDGLREIPDTEVVIVLNPDVVLEPTFVERGLAACARPAVGAVAPLLLRATASREQRTRNDLVDSYGTLLLSSFRAVNQFEGQGVPSSRFAVMSWPQPWGFTGAAAFLRRRALEDVVVGGEVFDEDLFAYRDDVDLSWRLRLRGWEIVGAPDARATHARSARPGSRKTPRVAQLSWRNYYLVLAKDAPTRALLRHLPGILTEDLARDLQMLCAPSLWAALPETLRLLPRMLAKREKVLARASAALYAAGDVPRREGKFPDGRIDYHHAAAAPVLSCVVRRGNDVLLLKRSNMVGSYKGWWHVVGGYLDQPGVAVEQQALIELQEELGIPKEAAADVRTAEPFEVFDPDVAKTWRIHPVLVEVRGDRAIALNWEHTEYRWVRPAEVPSYHLIPTVPEVLRRLGVGSA